MPAHEGDKIIIELKDRLNPDNDEAAKAQVYARIQEQAQHPEGAESISRYTAFGYADGDVVMDPSKPTSWYKLRFTEEGVVFFNNHGSRISRRASLSPERYLPVEVGDAARAEELYVKKIPTVQTKEHLLLLFRFLVRSGVSLNGLVARFQDNNSERHLQKVEQLLRDGEAQYFTSKNGLRAKVFELLGVSEQKLAPNTPVERHDAQLFPKIEVGAEAAVLAPEVLELASLPPGSRVIVPLGKGKGVRIFLYIQADQFLELHKDKFAEQLQQPQVLESVSLSEVLKLIGREGRGKYTVERVQELRIGTGNLSKKELEKPPQLHAARLQAFRDMVPGDIVIVGGDRYKKQPGGLWAREELSYEGTVIAVAGNKADLTDEEITTKLGAQLHNPDYVRFIARASEGLPFVEEGVETRKAVNERFARMLPELYPGAVADTRGYMTRLLNMVGAGRAGSTQLSLRQEVIHYFQTGNSLKQGGFGDCYLWAAHNGGKRSAPGFEFEHLARIIRPGTKRGEYEVRLPALDKYSTVELQEFYGDKFRDGALVVEHKAWKELLSDWATADPGDVILEKAYSLFQDFVQRGTQRRDTGFLFKKKLKAFEGGFGHRALHDLYGDDLVEKHRIGDYSVVDAYQSLRESGRAQRVAGFLTLFAQQPGRFIATANMKAVHKDRSKWGKFKREWGFSSEESKNEDGYYFTHAYSLVGFSDNAVYLENPHNTSKRLVLSLDKFLDQFSQISYVEIKKQYEPYEQPYIQEAS